MLIRSISLEGFTCFAEELTLDGFSDSVTVLHGPNGIGKSSIFRALHTALFRRYNATGAPIDGIRPWDRQLTPKIALEFEHAGHEYRLAKKFLQSRSVHLDRREGGTWTSFAEADQAERFLEAMTGGALGRAGTREFAGFAEVLWTSQGDLQLPALGESVVSAIQQSVGAQVSASGRNVRRKIAEDYERIFTPTGRLKTGKDICLQLQLQQQYDQYETTTKEAHALVCTYEDAAAMITTLQERVTAGEAQKNEFEEQVQRLRLQREQYRDLKSAVDNKQTELKRADSEWQRISDCIQIIQNCRREEAGLRDRLKKLSADLITQQSALQYAQEQWETEQIRQAECEHLGEAAQQAAETAVTAERYVSAVRERAEREREKTQIDEAKAELSQARQQAAGSLVPTRDDLADLQKHQAQAELLKSRLQSARVSLTFVAECATTLHVHDGEAPGPHAVAAGQTIVLAGTPHLSFSLAALGRMDISGPVTDYSGIAQAYAAETDWLRQFTERFGTGDFAELAQKRKEADELKERISSAQTRIKTLLQFTSERAIDSRLAELTSIINALEQQHPEWAANPPDAAGLRSVAAAQGKAAKAQLEQARRAATAAGQNYQNARRTLDRAESDIRNTNSGIESAGQRLAEARRDGLSDEQRETDARRAAAAVTTYGEQVKDLAKQLSNFPKNLEEDLATRERALKNLLAKLGSDHDALVEAKAQQSILGQENPYTALSMAQERLSVAKQKLEREKRRNEAVQLLYDTLNQVTAESLSTVAKPVAGRASQHLEFVCGKPLAQIRLGNSFQYVEVVPNGCGDQGRQVDCMSGGEREQIYLCTRLALAEELACQERQLVILDDVLTVTDTDRMTRICNLLELSANRLQVVILTCQPERFRPLRNAAFIDLLELIKRKRKAKEVA